MDESQRKAELETARAKIAELKKRKIEDIAHQVGIKGLVSDMETMGSDDWKITRTCLWWLLNRTDYPYDKTVLDFYADLNAVIEGHGDIRYIN